MLLYTVSFAIKHLNLVRDGVSHLSSRILLVLNMTPNIFPIQSEVNASDNIPFKYFSCINCFYFCLLNKEAEIVLPQLIFAFEIFEPQILVLLTSQSSFLFFSAWVQMMSYIKLLVLPDARLGSQAQELFAVYCKISWLQNTN